MGKHKVTKIIPYDAFETEALEAWLDEKAREGLQLESRFWLFATFRRTEPRNTRFRIDVGNKETLRREREIRNFYKKSGWNYVGSFRKFFDIYKTDDPEAPELNTDPMVLQQSLRRKTWLNLATFGAMVALSLLGFFLSIPKETGWSSLYALLDGNLEQILLFGALSILCFVGGVIELVRLYRNRGREAAGIAPCHKPHTPQRARKKAVGRVLVFILVVLSFQVGSGAARAGDWHLHYSFNKDIHWGGYQEPFHFPLLEEIDPVGWQEAMRSGEETPKSAQDILGTRKEFLAPLTLSLGQYLSWQKDEATGECAKELSYHVVYFEMRTEALAKKLMEEWAASFPQAQIWITETGATVGYSADEEGQDQAVQLGRFLVDVSYDGAVDLRERIPLFEAYLREAG